MADYPTSDGGVPTKNIPVSQGHVGAVIDSSIEGRPADTQTIGNYTTKKEEQ